MGPIHSKGLLAAVALAGLATEAVAWQASQNVPVDWLWSNVGFFVTLLLGAVGYGALRQRTTTTSEDIKSMKEELKALADGKADRVDTREMRRELLDGISAVSSKIDALHTRMDQAIREGSLSGREHPRD